MSEIQRLTALAGALRQDGRRVEAARAFAHIAQLVPNDWLAQHNAGAVSLEAELLDEAIIHLSQAVRLHSCAEGHSLHAHALALHGDMQAARTAYESAIAVQPADFAANWGLFEVDQLLADNEAALHHQRIALEAKSLVSIEALRQPTHTTILELCVAGTFQANIPLDFILNRERTTVHKLYLGVHPVPALPPYDIVFNTIADAPNIAGPLDAAQRFIAGQDRPSLNAPQLVGLTSRDSIANVFATSASVAVAPTQRSAREAVRHNHRDYPFLIRPLDSHAGNDLAKIDDDGALDTYLADTSHAEDFYLSAFIDYRNADGYFRKYRIVFVDGVPYPVHLAISPRWMIHYYNAPMAENAWMRDEEHAFMRDINSVFNGLAAEGLREIAQAIPLDYFGIDCSIASDGRVLMFEASTAMIVHVRDPIDLYPYKARYVPRVIVALEALIDDRLGRKAGG
jgi:tetratricopeptide (TPR) repeat protein